MDLQDLAIFQAVVQEGSVTKAAQKLHRVQSNVTTRIRQLEENLGVELFLREGKRLHLTSSGRILREYAERLLTLAEEARGAVVDGAPRGHLRVGSMESTAAARLPTLLAQFHQQHPQVQLELRTGCTAKMVNQVLAGALDCALVSGPIQDERLDNIPIFAEQLVVVAPSGHPPIHQALDVRTRTILTFEPGCAYRQRLEQWLASEHVVPEKIIELSSYHAIIGCVASGMGIALVPASLVSKLGFEQALTIHPLPSQFAEMTTVLVRRKEKMSGAVQALVGVLQQEQGC